MISVIIPVYNEEKNLSLLLDDLSYISDRAEIIVVDGGSTDTSIQIAKSENVKVLKSDLGRAKQMNRGAQSAHYDYLMFLHADSRLPKETLHELIKSLDKLESASFYLAFDSPGFLYRMYSRCSKINHYLFTYGDQGLIIKRSLFKEVGGFKNIPIMEDIDLVKRIMKSGRFNKLKVPIITSARRFKKNGIIFQQLKNIVMVLLYTIGVPPERLSKYYTYK